MPRCVETAGDYPVSESLQMPFLVIPEVQRSMVAWHRAWPPCFRSLPSNYGRGWACAGMSSWTASGLYGHQRVWV